jgi:hypothetical protein
MWYWHVLEETGRIRNIRPVVAENTARLILSWEIIAVYSQNPSEHLVHCVKSVDFFSVKADGTYSNRLNLRLNILDGNIITAVVRLFLIVSSLVKVISFLSFANVHIPDM